MRSGARFPLPLSDRLAYNEGRRSAMARVLLVLLIIAAAGYFIYQQTGRAPTDEDLLVDGLKERYAVVVNKFTSAVGRSGMLGVDTTFDLDSVVEQIKKIRTELADLRGRLTEARAIRKADALIVKVEHFCKTNNILRP
jgi:hypothetical protein